MALVLEPVPPANIESTDAYEIDSKEWEDPIKVIARFANELHTSNRTSHRLMAEVLMRELNLERITEYEAANRQVTPKKYE